MLSLWACRSVDLFLLALISLTGIPPQFLFLEPNASDPLNKDAAEDLRATRDTFKKNVRNSMAGGSVRGISFERVLR